jgi:hypothetical protein
MFAEFRWETLVTYFAKSSRRRDTTIFLIT